MPTTESVTKHITLTCDRCGKTETLSRQPPAYWPETDLAWRRLPSRVQDYDTQYDDGVACSKECGIRLVSDLVDRLWDSPSNLNLAL